MSDKSKYESLIFKFLTHDISDEESIQLETWAKKKKNSKIIEDYIKLNYLTNYSIYTFDALKAYRKASLHTEPKSIKRIAPRFFRYAAAAILVVALTTSYFFRDQFFVSQMQTNTSLIKNIPVEIGANKATLTLEDGTRVTLEKGQKYVSNNLKSNGKEIIYSPNPNVKSKIIYNYLTIPRGGQYFVKLADGTQVWLNSESQLKYPVSFIKGETRKVELIYGEAYFDVYHNGAAFKVQTGVQEIAVLGTEFNIKAYQGEGIYTTLVKGKVAISNQVSNTILHPGMQSKIENENDKIVLSNANIPYEIAWKNGFFRFKNKPLSEIVNTLARWYNVTVIYKNEEKKELIYSGSLKRTNSITTLLDAIQKTGNVEFVITNNTITIK